VSGARKVRHTCRAIGVPQFRKHGKKEQVLQGGSSNMTMEEPKVSPAQLYALIAGALQLALEGDSEKSD
jgi:hypothetical protein